MSNRRDEVDGVEAGNTAAAPEQGVAQSLDAGGQAQSEADARVWNERFVHIATSKDPVTRYLTVLGLDRNGDVWCQVFIPTTIGVCPQHGPGWGAEWRKVPMARGGDIMPGLLPAEKGPEDARPGS